MISKATAQKNRTLDLGMSAKEANEYSIAKGLIACLDNQPSLEREVSDTVAQQIGRPCRAGVGLLVPSQFRPQASGLDGKSDAAGALLGSPQVLSLVDALRAQLILTRLGVTFLPNLRFAVQIPRVDDVIEANWIVENAAVDAAESNLTFTACLGVPHTLQSTSTVSRMLLGQAASNVDLERALRLSITRAHATALDAAAISGDGSEGAPVGLLHQAGLPVLPINTNGGVASYNLIVDLEEAVAKADLPDEIGFLTTPQVRKLLRKTFCNGTGSSPVWGSDGLLGHTSAVSTSIPSELSKGTTSGTCHALVAGFWSELVIAEWGAVEILADEFAKKKSGMVELTSISMVDVICPHPTAFAAALDVTLS